MTRAKVEALLLEPSVTHACHHFLEAVPAGSSRLGSCALDTTATGRQKPGQGRQITPGDRGRIHFVPYQGRQVTSVLRTSGSGSTSPN
jgi:hypothetical protein